VQRLLLAALKPAKRAYANGEFDYIGGAATYNLWERPEAETEPDPKREMFIRKGGEYKLLESDVYDLRATMRYLAINWPKKLQTKTAGPPARIIRDRIGTFRTSRYWCVEPSFRISFMRAAHGLVDRGMLIPCDDSAGIDKDDIDLADILVLTHPDHHPPERQELARRVTQALLAVEPARLAIKPERQLRFVALPEALEREYEARKDWPPLEI
jgi:hypothetical protein